MQMNCAVTSVSFEKWMVYSLGVLFLQTYLLEVELCLFKNRHEIEYPQQQIRDLLAKVDSAGTPKSVCVYVSATCKLKIFFYKFR